MATIENHDTQLALSADSQSTKEADGGETSIVVNLFKAHARRVQNFLSFRLHDSTEAQDVTQEVFLKLWKHEARGELREEATNYMYAATQSAAIDSDRHRSYVTRDRVSDVDIDVVAREQPSAEEVLHWRKGMAAFVDSVKSLPDVTKKVFVLFHFKGLDYDEIAAQLGCSRRTVERHIAAGLAQCRERLKDYL
jgi:RNA polymerase sigma-70 factor (ECF subfamily)